MIKTALLFPGQGSQYAGMGRGLYENWPPARGFLSEADSALGRPLSKLIFNGPEDELTVTTNAQPAVFTISYIYWRWLLGYLPEVREFYKAGHSLGEYAAMTAAGVLEPIEALKLVGRRAELMQAAAIEEPGCMTAVLGLDDKAIQSVLDELNNTVRIANFNSPGQVVISGALSDMDAALAALKELKPKRFVRLPVGGAFHSPLMRAARAAFASELEEVEFHEPAAPVVVNYTAGPVETAPAAREALTKQITEPVRWVETITYLRGQGVDVFIEVGPGRVLTGLLKRIAPEATGLAFDKFAEPRAFLKAYKEALKS